MSGQDEGAVSTKVEHFQSLQNYCRWEFERDKWQGSGALQLHIGVLHFKDLGPSLDIFEHVTFRVLCHVGDLLSNG